MASFATNVQDLATAVATAVKETRSRIGDLASLSTTNRSSTVAAINEVASSAAAATGINDGTTTTTSTWSSQHISEQIAAAKGTDPATLIDDTTPSTTKVYSSSHTDAQIAAAKDELLGGAGAAFDTLKELQDALAGDETAITGIQDALGNRVRVDDTQAFNSTQQGQARSNIAAAAAADLSALDTRVGPDTDFAAVFTNALSS